jgi:hypothetical protein
MPQRGVRFGPGTVVSPGEYRNTETGSIRYFDGNTPIPGGVNSPSWEQVSDHYHAQLPEAGGAPAGGTRSNPERPSRPVVFPPGSMVSPGEYRNVDTGAMRYFDGNTALPGSVNSGSWQQVSDHYHAQHPEAPEGGGEHRTEPERPSRPVSFPPGTVVSPGEYRNIDTGTVHYFDGNTPLPGGVNASGWVQISDHYHASEEEMHPARRGE